MNVCECLTVTARLFPDRLAIVKRDREISYQRLDTASVLASSRLESLGVRPGDRVAVMLPNSTEFVVWYYAVLRLGAIAVSISTRLAKAEVDFVLKDSGAKVLVATVEKLNNLEMASPSEAAVGEVRPCPSDLTEWMELPNGSETVPASAWYDAKPDEPAVILYTSGTTGFPKGATLSHLNVRSNVCAFNHLCNMQSSDRILLAVPLFHCFGQNALLNSALNVGATLVLQDGFDLNETKRLIQRQRITQLYGVPMMFQLLLESCEREGLSTVHYCFSAAAPLSVQTSERWLAKFGLPIHEGYGLTETSPFASYNHRLRYKLGSIGTPIDCVEMKVVDTETGEDCPAGKLGEIAIRGPNVMLGYWNRAAETAEVIRDGWFHSGDIGRCDEDGFYYIVDRVKDMISVGGLKVFPAEVERVLLQHDEVIDAAVVGSPDPVFGEQVTAFVVLKPGLLADSNECLAQIQVMLKDHLANYKLPRHVHAIESLPRNPSGKILKTKLRELAEGMANDDAHRQTQVSSGRSIRPPSLRNQLQTAFASERQRIAVEFVQELVREIGSLPQHIDPATRFLDAGLDSMMLVELALQVQVEVGQEHELPTTLIFDFPRLEDLSRFLVEALSDSPQRNGSVTPVETTRQQHTQKLTQVRSASGSHQQQIESMSEEQALAELLKELD